MNNLHYIKETGLNTLAWCAGWNNICAVRNVFKDDYKHDEWPTTTVKAKQVGTEVLHAGLKILAWDKLLTLTVCSEPVLFEMTKHVKAPDVSIITNNITGNTLGLAALGFSGKHIYTNASEGMKHLRKTIQWDYNNNPILSFGDLGKSVAYLANAALVIPVGLCGYKHGAAASALAATALFATNHCGKLVTLGKPYAPVAGTWSKATLFEVAAKTAFVAVCYSMYGTAPV